eukprot:CAMPEP_0170057304 /NCGR_PEP_ID=MMETSP0019_2-20121128/361_1 /TAXON_ID=98059 /ORGANISM="Dinobryon sp., Strain UTEXLB2267" /LENGTH=389 /DNA_ID=CAMNT_0010261979 /DNA_START=205 /DNA_END=1374 /DNA_ORIENTATION=-
MADVFNAPGGDQDWDERVHQDFITENLGFAPWMAHGIHNSGGLTMTNRNAKEIYEAGGWTGKQVKDSPYDILNHKWIYMFGDSTTRQVWASFAASFQGNNFERNAKEWTRHYCNKQSNRVHHVKGGHFDDEGWRGPCGVNEVTCHVSGFGDKGLLSFDWKHFPFEDYDSWFWGDKGPWMAGFGGEGTRRPDMLTIQFGMHSCWHASPQGMYSSHLSEINSTMIEDHIAKISILMAAIRRAVDHTAEVYKNESDATGIMKPPPMVVIVTSGSTGMGDNATTIDNCILRFNRVASIAAHQFGFAVLERGEIERRLMFKSLFSPQPILTVDMHLPQPAQNIIATCLLHLFTCLNRTVSSSNGVDFEGIRYAKKRASRKRLPPARPLHSPPGA